MAISGLVRVMERAARKAGTRLRADFGEVEHLQVSRKGPADFVSKADRAAERRSTKNCAPRVPTGAC
jgi:myo-inositol-1(or 4)-monophosphatase